MKAYKGFTLQPDGSLKCRNKVYREGETYTESSAVLCKRGMHACLEPMDVFGYYHPADGAVVHEVEVDDDVKPDPAGDSKVASTQITIGARIDIMGMVKVHLDMVWDRVAKVRAAKPDHASSGDRSTAASSGDQSTAASSGYRSTAAVSGDQSTAASSGYQSTAASSGYRSTAASSGYQSTAASSGYRSTAASSGYQSTAAVSGDQSTAAVSGPNSVAVAAGFESKAKGADGCVLLLIERADWQDGYRIVGHKSVMVGHKCQGRRIKPDTWYQLVSGRVVEA